MAGNIYTASFEKVAVTAAQDLFELVAPSTAACIVHWVSISQDTEEGDAEDELLSILVHRGTATGSGGTTVTPNPMSPNATAFGGTVEANNTSQSVEATILYAGAMNVRAGFDYIWTPETRIVVPPSGLLIVELQDAPADSVTMSGTLCFEELGT